ncbi:maleylpyruvate isomerase family mycothiol-dependent enzyme [Streptomyces pathocidini]|uniref:Maleylpyruvate isomerase family mycothiol-dependent enzyme n=1 Tax=Streptomyces pathocidini TaxID=1650571 RepID=A0ABW7UV71_9ACTN|nr:maleylpyruvate isomerase family mycothiol-dependent enzyme [Streptomyces pathocidini]
MTHPMKHLPATEDTFRELAGAADRLLTDLDRLTDADIAAPSRLSGWTRGHVLSHLAAQVPALERLLEWARTGVERPQYADLRARDAEIEAGAGRPAAELAAEVRRTAAHFQQAVENLSEPAWKAVIRPFTGELCTPERILVIRLRELEVHHADLDLGYGFADIPDAALRTITEDVAGHLAQATAATTFELRDEQGAPIHRFGTGGPTVTGTRPDVLAWLTGRSAGEGLTTADGAALPALPGWI